MKLIGFIGIAALVVAVIFWILMRIQYLKLLQETYRLKEILGIRSLKTNLDTHVLESYGFNMVHTKNGTVGTHKKYAISLWKNDPDYYEVMIMEGSKTWLDKFDNLEELVAFTLKHQVEIKQIEQ